MTEPGQASAKVTGDPLDGFAIGTAIKFRPQLFPPFEQDVSDTVNNWEHFEGTVLALALRRGEMVTPCGSAVVIGPGLALTAKHVFETDLTDIKSGCATLFAFGIRSDGGQMWSIHQLVYDDTDVALLSLRHCSSPPSDLTYLTVPLSTRLPAQGERAMVVGFRGEVTANASDHGVEIRGDLRIAAGEITEVFPAGRDSVMIPFPCFAIKGRAIGGMSGGPVFDQAGHLIGVLTTSFDDEDGPAYAALLHRAMVQPIHPAWPSGVYKQPETLLDLATRSLVAIERADALVRDPETRTTSYHSWT